MIRLNQRMENNILYLGMKGKSKIFLRMKHMLNIRKMNMSNMMMKNTIIRMSKRIMKIKI